MNKDRVFICDVSNETHAEFKEYVAYHTAAQTLLAELLSSLHKKENSGILFWKKAKENAMDHISDLVINAYAKVEETRQEFWDSIYMTVDQTAYVNFHYEAGEKKLYGVPVAPKKKKKTA